MSNYESHSTAPVRKVKRLQFGILDPDFIVRLGWCWRCGCARDFWIVTALASASMAGWYFDAIYGSDGSPLGRAARLRRCVVSARMSTGLLLRLFPHPRPSSPASVLRGQDRDLAEL